MQPKTKLINSEGRIYLISDDREDYTTFHYTLLKRDNQPIRFLKILLKNTLIGSNSQWRRW